VVGQQGEQGADLRPFLAGADLFAAAERQALCLVGDTIEVQFGARDGVGGRR